MTVEMVEKAIDKMPLNIRIDEMVIRGRKVRLVYAHTDKYYLKWNAEGECYCYKNDKPLSLKPLDTRSLVDECEWKRIPLLDLNMDL